MILGKLWRALKAQLNKLTNYFRRIDPIAEMQLECDLATEQMKQGRLGLEQYRGLVERVARQVRDNRSQVAATAAKVQAYLNAGDRNLAATFALEHERARANLTENETQLRLHEEAYENNLLKLKHAGKKLAEVRERIATYDAKLRMSRAEAEIMKLGQSLQFDVTTDFGQVEQIVQDKIDRSRAEVRVAVDLSSQGLDTIRQEQAVEKAWAEAALARFESLIQSPDEAPLLRQKETT